MLRRLATIFLLPFVTRWFSSTAVYTEMTRLRNWPISRVKHERMFTMQRKAQYLTWILPLEDSACWIEGNPLIDTARFGMEYSITSSVQRKTIGRLFGL